MTDAEGPAWQRLDAWLWCARFLKSRGDCARLVSSGHVRINRQTTEKAHARLRPGDVLTLALRGDVRVVRVLHLADRRGPATEARKLFEDIAESAQPINGGQCPGEPRQEGIPCASGESSAYRP